VIGLGLLGLGWYFFFHKPKPIVKVQTEKVTRRNVTEQVVANGKIQPVIFVKISPEVSGEIIELPVKEGQDIKKGDLLMKIKPDIYIASRNIAEAMYKAAQAQDELAKANLDKAYAELKRNDDLFRTKLISDSQYLEAKTSYEVGKAAYQSAKHQTDNARANLARAEEDLSKTTVYSPLSGTISKLNSQLGERVVGTAMYAGTEVMTIADLSTMEARVDVGEIDVVLIAIGQKARLEVDSFRDNKFTGSVSDIANTAKTSALGAQQEATKFEVRVRIQEKEAFRPGMSVTAYIETRMRTNVLTVPIQSVTTRMPKEPKGKKPGAQTDKSWALVSEAKADEAPAGKTNRVAKAKGKTNSVEQSAANNKPKETDTNTVSAGRKSKEGPKPIEVVFLVDQKKAKMVPVKRGISDDDYVEITEGLTEGQEVVSGGYKAINRELDEDKDVNVDNSKPTGEKGDKKEEQDK
jgi:HlyD family secretion protein